MRKIFTSLTAGLLISASSFGQIGTVATDFTVTDLDGNEQHLYALLDSGFVVILDCSATWCGPCWGFHTGGYLEDINATYGPQGTNQVRVLFYEADAATTLADLQGLTGGTQGDWLTGSDFPFINETPLQLSGSKYWPLGFPTVNVISPLDNKIKADLWDSGSSLSAMVNVIDDYFAVWATTNEEAPISQLSSYPTPSTTELNVNFHSLSNSQAQIEIYNMLGEKVETIISDVVVGTNLVTIGLSNYSAGQYVVSIKMDETVSTLQFNVVK